MKNKIIHRKVTRDSFTIKGQSVGDALSAIVHPTNGKIFMSWISGDMQEQEVGLSRHEAEAWVALLQAAMNWQDEKGLTDD